MLKKPFMAAALMFSAASAAHGGSAEREMLLLMDIPVVVTASKTEQPINEAPATIEVITDKDIERYGFRTLTDALRMVPGMDIGNTGYSVYYSARGLNGRKSNTAVLVLIDGHPINDLPRGSVDPCSLLLSNVARIEVIRGPGSSLYGANAFAGVVNIITKSAAENERASVTLGKGNYGNTHIAVTAGAASENFNLFVAGENLYTDATCGHALANDDRDDRQYFGKVRAGGLSLFWERLILDSGIPGVNIDDQRGKIAQDLIGFEWDHPLSERTSIEILSHLMLLNLDIAQQYVGTLSADAVGSAVETQLHSRLNSNNTLVAGFEYKNDQTDAPSIGIDRRSIATRALYAQNETRISDRLILTAGGRYDIPTGFGSVFSPRVNLAYKFSDRTVAKAAYGEAFRAPTMLELYGEFFLAGGLLDFDGNADLKPEKIRSTELGISHIASADTQFSVNLFSIKTIDMMELRSSVAGFITHYRYVNKSSAEVLGGEATLRHRLARFWEAVLSYSYQDAKDAETGTQLALAPHHKVSMQHSFTLTDKLILSTVSWYIGERDEIWENQRTNHKDPVSVTNAHVSYACTGRLKLACGIKNIFNNTYEELDTFSITGVSYLAEATYRF